MQKSLGHGSHLACLGDRQGDSCGRYNDGVGLADSRSCRCANDHVRDRTYWQSNCSKHSLGNKDFRTLTIAGVSCQAHQTLNSMRGCQSRMRAQAHRCLHWGSALSNLPSAGTVSKRSKRQLQVSQSPFLPVRLYNQAARLSTNANERRIV